MKNSLLTFGCPLTMDLSTSNKLTGNFAADGITSAGSAYAAPARGGACIVMTPDNSIHIILVARTTLKSPTP